MPNIHEPSFEGPGPKGFGALRARIGKALGCEQIGLSVFEVPPGEAAYPFHFHYGAEEIVIVLSGRPTLRTEDGALELKEGEAVHFPPGEKGVHQILNRSEEPVRFLAISSAGRLDVIVYPDSDKIGIGGQLPPGGMHAFFRRGDAVDYFHGEGSEPGAG